MRKPRGICYPQGPSTGRGCYPEPPDMDGCYSSGLLGDLLRVMTTPPKRPRPPDPKRTSSTR